MTASERRKIMCSVTFHIIAITCVVWSLYVLIDRTAEEIKQGQTTGTLLASLPTYSLVIIVYPECREDVEHERTGNVYIRLVSFSLSLG